MSPLEKFSEDIFVLPEGRVAIQYPTKLSPESFEDFEAFLQIVARKVNRSVEPVDYAKPTREELRARSRLPE